MKNFILTSMMIGLSSLAAAPAIFAQTPVEPSLRVTSFVYPYQNLRLAELCGVVDNGGTLNHKVRVLIDPNTSYAAVYMTETDRTGNFCLMLRSLSGRALVAIEGQTPVEQSISK